jgi:uncharacterized membrane protein YeaQ/YmgE (transglycosylase-associated protein family)
MRRNVAELWFARLSGDTWQPMEDGMSVESLIIWLIIGGVAGWLAGQLWKGGGFGLPGNIVIGIVGSLIGGFVLGGLGIGIGGPWIGAIINAVIGSLLLLFGLSFVKR